MTLYSCSECKNVYPIEARRWKCECGGREIYDSRNRTQPVVVGRVKDLFGDMLLQW